MESWIASLPAFLVPYNPTWIFSPPAPNDDRYIFSPPISDDRYRVSSPPASDDDSYLDELWKQPTRARLLVSDADAGRVIGMAGSGVAAVQSTTGAHVRLSRRGQFLPGTENRIVLVSGLFHQVMDATEIILQKIRCQDGQVIDDRATVLVVPDACCGPLIGKGGTMIKSLAEASDARIMISPYAISYGLHDRLVTITGKLDNQLQALFLILSELLKDDAYTCAYPGVSSISYPASSVLRDGPEEHVERYHNRLNTTMRSPDNNADAHQSLTLAIADEHIGAVIGCGGRKIKEIQKVTGARIWYSMKGVFIAGTTDREVVIRGTEEAIDAAKVMIMEMIVIARRHSVGGEKPPLKSDTTHQHGE